MRHPTDTLKACFGSLFDRVSAILFELDPVGINFGTNTDEYAPEVATILPRLRSCGSADDLRRVVHEEFVRWFGEDTAGAEAAYRAAADRIWIAWRRFPQC